MTGHARERVLGQRVHDRDDRESHDETHDQGIALHVGVEDPAARIEPQPVEHPRACVRERHGQDRGSEEPHDVDAGAASALPRHRRASEPRIDRAREEEDDRDRGERQQQHDPASEPAPATVVEPLLEVSGEEGALDERSAEEREAESRDQGERHPDDARNPGVADREARGQELPQARAEEEREGHAEERSQDRGDDHPRHRRDDDRGEEPEHDARQARHHLDRRLDRRAHLRGEELAREDRREQRERHGEEHRHERRLDGSEDERDETELRLEVVRAPRRLPGVLGLGVSLVPDRGEEGCQRRFGVAEVDAPPPRARRTDGEESVLLRLDLEKGHRPRARIRRVQGRNGGE